MNIFVDTPGGLGPDFDRLIDGSVVDDLHEHAKLVASDGSVDPAVSVDASGNTTVAVELRFQDNVKVVLGSTQDHSISGDGVDLVLEPDEQDTGSGLIKLKRGADLDLTIGTSPEGVLYKDEKRFIHDFTYGANGTITPAGENLFIGIEAGNFTLGSTATGAWESSYNAGIGRRALYSLTKGYQNIAVGVNALGSMTTGNKCVGIGYAAAFALTTANNTVAIGAAAARFIADGTTPCTTASRSTYIGSVTRASANGITAEIAIGYGAIGRGTNTVTIGTTYNNANYFYGQLVTNNGRVKGKERFTGATTLSDSAQEIFCNTDGGAYTVNLDASPDDGRCYRLSNTGTSGNNLNVGSNGKNIKGAAIDAVLADGESINLCYDPTDHWY